MERVKAGIPIFEGKPPIKTHQRAVVGTGDPILNVDEEEGANKSLFDDLNIQEDVNGDLEDNFYQEQLSENNSNEEDQGEMRNYVDNLRMEDDYTKSEEDRKQRMEEIKEMMLEQERENLKRLNIDQLTLTLEMLCKDFLETLINKQAYNIKMSQIDIIKLMKDDELRLKKSQEMEVTTEEGTKVVTITDLQQEITEYKKKME
mmetsp:Transcript_4388/g.4145  ORF Transcript_4388/g.4145 Transcript_4388/m.4145 type:complete len:203 (+) Transcript_4388:178-786(+)